MARKRRYTGGAVAISVSLVLFVLGLFISLLHNTNKLTTYLQENVLVILYFEGETSEMHLNHLADSLSELSDISHTKVVTADEAAIDYKEVLGKDFVDVLGNNPLPSSIEINLNAAESLDHVEGFVKELEAIPGVDDVQFQEDLAVQIDKNKQIAATVLLLLAGLLLIVSLILINNTIRLDVYAKRFVVKSMQLVGASEWFIVKPFIWKSLQLTAIATVVSFGLVVLVNKALTSWVEQNFFEVSHIFDGKPVQYAVLFALIALFGLLIVIPSAYFATKKYLRLRIEDLY